MDRVKWSTNYRLQAGYQQQHGTRTSHRRVMHGRWWPHGEDVFRYILRQIIILVYESIRTGGTLFYLQEYLMDTYSILVDVYFLDILHYAG